MPHQPKNMVIKVKDHEKRMVDSLPRMKYTELDLLKDKTIIEMQYSKTTNLPPFSSSCISSLDRKFCAFFICIALLLKLYCK